MQAVVVIKLGHANQPSLSIENDARIGLWIEAGGVVALSNGLKVDVRHPVFADRNRLAEGGYRRAIRIRIHRPRAEASGQFRHQKLGDGHRASTAARTCSVASTGSASGPKRSGSPKKSSRSPRQGTPGSFMSMRLCW